MDPTDAEDASPSPEPGTEFEESGTMAEDKVEHASNDEKSPSNGSNKGSATAKGNGQPAKSNSKDPSRPRRKKARRACFACQRAHLTCGDERPCLRCIKRGLQDQCHDGVRKKAKYLHDAPAEALVPGFNGQYHMNGSHGMQSAGNGGGGAAEASDPNAMSGSQGGNYFPQVPQGQYQPYQSVPQPAQIPPSMLDTPSMMGDFGSTQGVGTPPYQSSSSQQVSPAQGMPNLDQPSLNSANPSFDANFFDPNDPSLFNFDVSGLNFGNHYGALEFGMLGHMSSGAVGTPDLDAINSMGGQSHQGSLSYDGNTGFSTNYGYNQQPLPNYMPMRRQNSSNSVWTGQNAGMDAYTIGEAPLSMTGASPHSQTQDFNTGYQSNTMSPETQFAQPDQNQQPDLLRQTFTQAPQRKHHQYPNSTFDQASSRKRRHDTSAIYTNVKAPYPYTQGFHALTAFLQKRYNSKKTLKIAKALASIRPSFISCNKNLNTDDLIFMEKSFQRTLLEYEGFVECFGTPTIICRRTGEIAAVSKEFTLVTGWRRDVLLGKEPNLNVNTGSNASGTQTGSSSRGATTPRIPNIETDPGRPQPVFLAELMDEDSVVQFYEDFAELAFGASRSSVIGEKCSLLKYKTKEDPGWGATEDESKRSCSSNDVKSEFRGQDGVNTLGDRDGKVDCRLCWTVKRDTFDIPMLITMNFLPMMYATDN
ncbi:hypothetical protein MBLNU230_g8340t1 [Neophaeotheca triangularis]